jgi:uncharacterized sulfatase
MAASRGQVNVQFCGGRPQHRPRLHGYPLALTPNIDALARRGVRFERACCQYPVCNEPHVVPEPGIRKRPACRQSHQPAANLKDACLPEFMRRNGWFTARVG